MPAEERLLDLIAARQQGVLAAVLRNGYPHLSNVLYLWDPARRIARISTTADRVKAQALANAPRAALHVAGDHFWSYAVANCDAELSDVAATPGDEACRELLEIHSAFYGTLEESTFFTQMIEARRLVIRLRVKRVYGVLLDTPPNT
jgi:PPOX class probable F420-dependent enzyme